MAEARIASLHIYPIKGCRGQDLSAAEVTETGLRWDREWMFVNDNGRFLTQRECAGMARVDVSVNEDELVLTSPGHAALHCNLRHDAGGEQRQVVIWKDTCPAVVSRTDTRSWLEKAAGVRGQLVRAVSTYDRVCDPYFTGPDKGRAFFADAYSMLIATTESLAALNERLPEPLPMNRFRPNIVIEGVEPFDEDRMVWVRSGAFEVKCVKPCTRCIVTTTDQRTGERMGEEPLRTLRAFRWLPSLKGVAFGMNAIVTGGAGSQLRIGQRMDIEWHPASEAPRWTFHSAGVG